MNCPRCGAEYTELKSVVLRAERVNEYGHKEIVFQAEHENWVEWKDKKYHCKKCDLTFTFQEGTSQKLNTPSFSVKWV